jgi:RHH-type transcriptional regulator, proline utilization regulon repressor / proline dehydrogenase / delta 1-pyrroline-5-carboxylate dehydrogenase
VKLAPFENEPTLELRQRHVRERLLAALSDLDDELPLRVGMLVGGERSDGEELASTDPGMPDRVVALGPMARPADARRAVDVACSTAPSWARVRAEERARALLGAADWMRARRGELAALCVRECAKPWVEADADVAEAIDYFEYYARGALTLDGGVAVMQAPGESNRMLYAPRGVCAVIAPWNFPLAIPAGMASAALATGNSVVLKPAEQAPACGAMVVEALRAGGVWSDALGLLPGEGDVGAALVRDERVHTIAFTGSAAVGAEIVKAAAELQPGQRHIKRVVAEMGGKNCVIVDSDADLDEAVPAIVRSAFAYAGQKCSAAAIVLVHTAIAEELLTRLSGAVAALQVGQAETFGTDVGPLIEREALDRVRGYAELAKAQGVIVAERGDSLSDGGWFCAPQLVTALPRESPILSEEIFGPLLAVEEVADVDEALARVDSLPFALTGGLFCRNPRTIERVAASVPVGNLYINRQITGAMVGRQPFGGNRLSGSGAKAGGPGYLLEFVEGRAVSENVMRHGLVV